MRSMPAKFNKSWVGSRPTNSSKASAKPCVGISRIKSGSRKCLEVRTEARELETPNTKLQKSSKRQAAKSALGAAYQIPPLEAWFLDLFWCLVFGLWCLQ